MSITTITYKVMREPLDVDIKCPQCGNRMLVENLYNKRKRFDGTTATCIKGCRDDDDFTQPLVYYSYDLESVIDKIKRFNPTTPQP